MNKNSTLILRIEPALEQRLREQRIYTGCSVSEFVRRAIAAALDAAEKSKS